MGFRSSASSMDWYSAVGMLFRDASPCINAATSFGSLVRRAGYAAELTGLGRPSS